MPMTTMMVMTAITWMIMTTTRTAMTTRVTQLWDLIEARGFCKDIMDISNNNDDTPNDEDQYQTKPKHTILNNTKIGITRTFLKLQAPDFAW